MVDTRIYEVIWSVSFDSKNGAYEVARELAAFKKGVTVVKDGDQYWIVQSKIIREL